MLDQQKRQSSAPNLFAFRILTGNQCSGAWRQIKPGSLPKQSPAMPSL